MTETCLAFVVALERARRLYDFRVYGFVAMPEHAHLLISEPESGTVAKAVQALKISSSLRTVQSRDCSECRSPLWQKRYYDRNVRDYAEFVEKLQYIHRNPVKRRTWWHRLKTGSGAASATMHCTRNAAWKLNRNGRRTRKRHRSVNWLQPHSSPKDGGCGPPARRLSFERL